MRSANEARHGSRSLIINMMIILKLYIIRNLINFDRNHQHEEGLFCIESNLLT